MGRTLHTTASATADSAASVAAHDSLPRQQWAPRTISLGRSSVDDVSNVPADRQAAFDALKGGDGVPENDKAFSSTFPYIGSIHTHAVNETVVDDGQHGLAVPGNGGSGRFDALIPALTGSAALLLLGSGAVSLIRGRSAARGRTLATDRG